MQTHSFRPAERSDAPTVARFVHALLDELSGAKAPPLDEILTRTQAVLGAPGVVGVLALDEGAPVGVMMLNECRAIYAGGVFGEISELYVVPALRSHGVARGFLDAAQAEAKARGWKRLEVGAPTQPTWSRSLAFYLSNGFDEVGPRLRRLI